MEQVQAILGSLGSVALVVGIVVAVVQLRLVARQRQDEVVMRIYAPLFDVPLTRAYWHVQRLTLDDYAAFAATASLDDWVALD